MQLLGMLVRRLLIRVYAAILGAIDTASCYKPAGVADDALEDCLH